MEKWKEDDLVTECYMIVSMSLSSYRGDTNCSTLSMILSLTCRACLGTLRSGEGVNDI